MVGTLAGVAAMAPALPKVRGPWLSGGAISASEPAAVAAKSGMKVTLIEMADRILQRVASVETSDYFPHPA